jgi:DNA-binding LacI/PurR family transcriptional regulator
MTSLHDHGVHRVFPGPGYREPFDDPTGFGQGPELQVDHLHALGHRRLAFATSTDLRFSPMAEARVAVAQRRAAALGLQPLPVRGIGTTSEPEKTQEILRSWRQIDITAVVAYNDEVAAAVAGAALRLGLDIPTDLAVIGYDDNPISSLFVPSLSTIRTDTAAIGRHLAQVALHLVNDEEPDRSPPPVNAVVVSRESTIGSC